MPFARSIDRRTWLVYTLVALVIVWAWLVFVVLRFHGDRSWIGTIAIFSPRWLLLAPVIVGLLLLRWVGWRARFVLGLAMLVPCFAASGFHLPLRGWIQERAIVYRLLTCNVANWDGGARGIERLIHETRADIIMLQEYNDDADLNFP